MNIEFMGYKPLEQDHKFWMVVNPATWLMPILIVVAAVAVTVHLYAFSLPGQGFSAKTEAAPVAEAAPAAAAAPEAPAK
jgi:light-harvesting protein B-800-850 alpha chain